MKVAFLSRMRERRLGKKTEELATEIRISRSRKLKRNQNTSFRAGCVSDGNTHPLGARPKGSNGGVAVGLPHRNSSVF